MEARQFHLRVAGVTHSNKDGVSRQSIIERCVPGEELRLVPEPDNPVDKKAVMVCRLNGEQLGYIQHGRCTKKMFNYGCWLSSIDRVEGTKTYGCGLLFIDADPDTIATWRQRIAEGQQAALRAAGVVGDQEQEHRAQQASGSNMGAIIFGLVFVLVVLFFLAKAVLK